MKQANTRLLISFISSYSTGFVKFYGRLLFILLFVTLSAHAQDSTTLQRSLDNAPEINMELSSETAEYKVLLGAGDRDEEVVKGIKHYGHLSVAPEGVTPVVNFGREEMVYYVLEGTGMLYYDGREVPISKNDFFYVPVDTDHRFSNPRERTLSVMVMGFEIPEDREIQPTPELMLASADEVPFEVLEDHGHGPTSSFQLLMGTKNSRRDRLAAAHQMNSLYVIDFEPGGTNNPHRHPREEEIYFVLQGQGEMVAGETPGGEEKRYSAEPGDLFFFGRNELVGFYSDEDTEEHARILAVRYKYPEQE